MHALRLVALALPLAVGAGLGARAQISSVTRPTVQWPLPRGFFFPTGNPAVAGAAGSATAPRWGYVYVPPPAAPKGEAERLEAQRRLLAFQRSCAERGLPGYQYDWGIRCLTGDGVEKDPLLARQWLAQAAKQGHEKAAKKVAELDKATALAAQR